MIFWTWQLEKYLNLTCSLNEYNAGGGAGWARRKATWRCVKSGSFCSQGLGSTYFSFSSCRFPSLGEKFWLSGWKKLNGAETTSFDVLSGWVEEKKEVERLPQPHSNFSYKSLPLTHFWSPDSWLTSLPATFKLNYEPKFLCISLLLEAHSLPVREGQGFPERPICPPNVILLTFLKFPWGPGTAINRESGFEPTSIIYYLYDIGGLTTKLLMQTLMFFLKLLTFVLLPQNHIVAPTLMSQSTRLVLIYLSIVHSPKSVRWLWRIE